MKPNLSNTTIKLWRDCLLSFVMVVVALRGSENRRPLWNLLICLAWIWMYCPSFAVAALRPKHLVRRLVSGLVATVDEESLNTTTTSMTDQDDSVDGIGGGAINEKKRHYVETSTEDPPPKDHQPIPMTSFAPVNHASHLYHALEGLDRYPNYLARWQEPDMDKLEASLEEKLAQVRKQRQEVVQERRQTASQLVESLLQDHPEKERWKKLVEPCQTWQEVQERILDPTATKAIFHSKMMNPKRNKADSVPTVQAVRQGQVQVQLDPEHLESWLDEELYDVYSFRLLSDGFCQDLREYVRALAQLSEERDDHPLGSRPFNLDLIGLRWVNDLLFHLVMRPLARELFLQSEQLGSDLDWRHGYIAGYSAQPGSGKPRERLVTHTDDSEVTLNVCLGDEFTGGLLEFRGLRGTSEEGQLLGTFEPQLGLGLIHAGRHFHDVTQVLSGDRFAFIIWARSWSGIRAVKCPCCWLNRREDTNCVCGPRWN